MSYKAPFDRAYYERLKSTRGAERQSVIDVAQKALSNSKKAKRYSVDVESSFIEHVAYKAGVLTVTIAGYGEYDFDASLDDYRALINADSVGKEFNANIRE